MAQTICWLPTCSKGFECIGLEHVVLSGNTAGSVLLAVTQITNSFPIWRSQLRVGERREFRMAWISAPELTVEAKAQAYSR